MLLLPEFLFFSGYGISDKALGDAQLQPTHKLHSNDNISDQILKPPTNQGQRFGGVTMIV